MSTERKQALANKLKQAIGLSPLPCYVPGEHTRLDRPVLVRVSMDQGCFPIEKGGWPTYVSYPRQHPQTRSSDGQKVVMVPVAIWNAAKAAWLREQKAHNR